jgi:MFS family permease
VIADRFNRRQLLVLTNIGTGVLQVGMGLTLMSGSFSLPLMIVLGAVSGTVSAFNGPALRGIVPELVLPDLLQSANAALSTSRSAARIAGPIVAGILVGTIGGGWALIVDAATSILAVGFFLMIPRAGNAKTPGSLLEGLKTGWNTFSSTQWIWISSLSFAVINSLNVAPLQILGTAIVTPVLGAAAWGALLSGRTVGTLLASALMVKWTLKNPLVAGRIVGVLAALPLFGFWWTINFWVLLALSFLGGIGFSVLTTTYDATLHARVPGDVMSRVAAWDDLFAFCAIPISQLLVGPVAAAVGNRELALWCFLGLILATLLPLIARSIRMVDRQPLAPLRRS